MPIYLFLKNLSKNQWIAKVGRKTVLDFLMQGQLEQIVQDHIQLEFEYLHT